MELIELFRRSEKLQLGVESFDFAAGDVRKSRNPVVLLLLRLFRQ